MPISARDRKKMSLIDELSDAMDLGVEAGAIALVRGLPAEGDPAIDHDAWMLAERAIAMGWPGLAMAMVEARKAGGMDAGSALAVSGEIDRLDSFEALSAGCGRFDLLRCAYKSRRAGPLGGPGAVHAQAIERAGRLRLGEWEAACQEGLASRWAARPKMAYESACESWGVPLWSANAAGSVGGESQRGLGIEALHVLGAQELPFFTLGVECMAHEGSALGLPEETLLWSQADVQSLSAETARQGSAPFWRGDLLAPMLAGWEAARIYLPRAASLASGVRKDGSGGLAERFAKDIVELGIQRWAPFMLAWSVHGPFGPAEAKAFEPVLRACVIDASNVGLVAANIDYGSFNARVAVIAVAARQAGAMDDAASAVVAARLHDMAQDPVLSSRFSNLNFGAEMSQAWRFFQAQGCRLEMGAAAQPAMGKARARGL